MADAVVPELAHGETDEKPMPVPNATSASDKAAATNAPAITAPQETPELLESFGKSVAVDTAFSILTCPFDHKMFKKRGSLKEGFP
jgi:hypothetical protein